MLDDAKVKNSWSFFLMGSGGILVMCYSALMVHTARGNKNRWLMFIIFLLLVSNLNAVIYGFMRLNRFTYRNPDLSPAHYITSSWSFGTYIACFNLSHFLVAAKYNEICKRVPTMLNGEQEKAPSLLSRVLFWALAVVNFGSGLMMGFSYARSYPCWLGSPKCKHFNFYNSMRTITDWACKICALISGVILVVAAYRIRKFFRERDATEFIDTAMLCRHGTAFGLYILGALIAATA